MALSLFILARHAISHVVLMLQAWRPSVRLYVTLVDCDNTVQQKVEISKWQDRSVSWLSACQCRPGSYYHVTPNSTKEYQTEQQTELHRVLHFDGNSVSNGSHVALYISISW